MVFSLLLIQSLIASFNLKEIPLVLISVELSFENKTHEALPQIFLDKGAIDLTISLKKEEKEFSDYKIIIKLRLIGQLGAE